SEMPDFDGEQQKGAMGRHKDGQRIAAADTAQQKSASSDGTTQATGEQAAQTSGKPQAGEAVAAEGPQAVIGTAESEQYGTYLTDDAGRAVYMFESDQRGEGAATAK